MSNRGYTKLTETIVAMCKSIFDRDKMRSTYVHIGRYMSSCIKAMCNFTCDFRTAVASRWFPFDCYHIRFVCRIRDHQIRLSRRRWWTCNKTYKRVQTETTRTSNIIESHLLRLREIRIALKRDVVGVR